MKLTNNQLLALGGSDTMRISSALMALHGILKPTGQDGKDGKPIMDTVPYEFAPGVRMKLAIIMSKVWPMLECFEKARGEIVKKYKKQAVADSIAAPKERPIPPVLTEGCPCWDDFLKDITALQEEVIDIDRMPRLNPDDLNADENKIAANTIMALVPLFEAETEKPAAKSAKAAKA